MKHIQVTDEWLYRYMPVVDKAIIRALEDGTNYEYPFSEKFQRKMKALIWKESHLWANAVYRQLKRAAALFGCVVLSIFLLSMSAESKRFKLFETVRTLLEDNAVEHTYITDQEYQALPYQKPGYLPEGYRETDRHVLDNFWLLVYQNDAGEMITWEQFLVSGSNGAVLDTEYDSQETREVNGKYVTICSYAGGYKYAYCEHEESVYIMTADRLTIDEICRMFSFEEPD